MKKKPEPDEDDEMRPEYDFAELGEWVRGKYARQYREGTNLILLEPDVAKAFPNDVAVNEALRFLMRVAADRPSTR